MTAAQEAGDAATDMLGSLAVTGTAALAGTLQASLVYGYTPTTTDTFTPITFASYTGGFTSTSLPSGLGYQLESATSFTNVVVSAAPIASVTTTVSAGTILHAVATGLSGVNLTLWDGSAVSSQTQQLTAAAGLRPLSFSWRLRLRPASLRPDTERLGAQFRELRRGHRRQRRKRDGDLGLRLRQPAGRCRRGGLSAGQHHGHGAAWRRPAMGDRRQQRQRRVGVGELADCQLLGLAAGRIAAGRRRRLQFPPHRPSGAFFDHQILRGWQRGERKLGARLSRHARARRHQHRCGTDAATYAAFCCQFVALAQPIVAAAGLPPISIGIIAGDVTQSSPDTWTTTVLTACENIGFVPGFLIDHNYAGGDNDYYLLNETMSDPYSVFDWSTRYNNLESQLQDYFGSQASSVQIMATEFNSTSGGTGKQTTSLVNGLFLADSLGSLMDSHYAAATVWDLRNGNVTNADNSNSLYGWREYGDYGLLDGYVTYPTYFAEELASKLIVAGGQVVSAASSYGDLDVYAVRESNSHLELLVINKNPAAAITSQFNLTGFQPSGAAQAWQYGKAEDLAQSESSTSAASLTYTSTTLSLNGANFSYTFPSYSMTVIDLAPSQTLTSIAISPATVRLASNKTQQFTATAIDQYGDPMATQPTFNWTLASGVGGVNSSGLYIAPATTGTASVKAAYGGLSPSGLVTVTNASPTVATAAAASPGTVIASTAALSVLGADWWRAIKSDVYVERLERANRCDGNVQRQWNQRRTEHDCHVQRGGRLQAGGDDHQSRRPDRTSTISVTVDQTLTSVAVSPGNATLATNGMCSSRRRLRPVRQRHGDPAELHLVNLQSTLARSAVRASIQRAACKAWPRSRPLRARSAPGSIDATSLPAPLAWYRFDEGAGTRRWIPAATAQRHDLHRASTTAQVPRQAATWYSTAALRVCHRAPAGPQQQHGHDKRLDRSQRLAKRLHGNRILSERVRNGVGNQHAFLGRAGISLERQLFDV